MNWTKTGVEAVVDGGHSTPTFVDLANGGSNHGGCLNSDLTQHRNIACMGKFVGSNPSNTASGLLK